MKERERGEGGKRGEWRGRGERGGGRRGEGKEEVCTSYTHTHTHTHTHTQRPLPVTIFDLIKQSYEMFGFITNETIERMRNAAR